MAGPGRVFLSAFSLHPKGISNFGRSVFQSLAASTVLCLQFMARVNALGVLQKKGATQYGSLPDRARSTSWRGASHACGPERSDAVPMLSGELGRLGWRRTAKSCNVLIGADGIGIVSGFNKNSSPFTKVPIWYMILSHSHLFPRAPPTVHFPWSRDTRLASWDNHNGLSCSPWIIHGFSSESRPASNITNTLCLLFCSFESSLPPNTAPPKTGSADPQLGSNWWFGLVVCYSGEDPRNQSEQNLTPVSVPVYANPAGSAPESARPGAARCLWPLSAASGAGWRRGPALPQKEAA